MADSFINLIYENESFPLENEIKIGREKDNHICIPDDFVSRHHCLVQRTGDYSLEIADLNSSNGTYLLSNGGDFEEIDKVVFSDLRNENPEKIVLGKDIEIIFHFPNLKTKNLSSENTPFSLGTVHSPGVLNGQNIELITKIYPNAGAVMLRRELETFLFKELGISPNERLSLQELIDLSERNYKLDNSAVKKMKGIQHIGNMGAHKDNVNEGTVLKKLKDLNDVKKVIEAKR
jgi:hypothetical protein